MLKLSSSKLSDSAFILHCCIYLIMVILFFFFNSLYLSLDSEFGFLELSGAAALLLTSILLFVSCYKWNKISATKNRKFWLLFFAGLLFFWAFGEEISWGQHFFGTETPAWLAEINAQNETNLHNINKKFFDRYLERCTFLLVLVTTIFHLRGKELFLDFRLPEYPLILGFILMPAYRQFEELGGQDIWPLGFLLVFIYIYISHKTRDVKLLIFSVLVFLVALIIITVHHNNIELFQGKSNIYHEVKEMLFSYLCAFYAFQLKRDL